MRIAQDDGRGVNMILRVALFIWFLVLLAVSMEAQRSRGGEEVLLDVLVWGMHMGPVRPDAFTGALKEEVDAYLRRATSYQSTRPVPPAGGLLDMVYDANVRYERRLAAVSDAPEGSRLAVEYVDSLRPCYEWEGSRECPEREALFADQYQSAHASGPFSQYLPLLSAHRWLCVAEAIDAGEHRQESEVPRQLSRDRLASALQSRMALVRSAAQQLSLRGRCYAS
jgi:hypothetical protein